MRTHTKDRPYMCRYCDKRFSSCGEVRCHEMLHTGDTPHQCVYCGKGYTKSFSLQCHYLSHSGPHECHVCPKTFIDMKFLRTHLKRVHKFEEFDEA
ncbi:hypothetical protein BDFB_006010 [Asbolus verrucosus]|uniref:C2H2-type domain-containing protein n=1 Tax=Asbolus verrucosus TaxID=1661398 RepID=A0A482WB49_ASBVE|nr:hypothetical protein BDFB_006010 [Asbolus verrucosus]